MATNFEIASLPSDHAAAILVGRVQVAGRPLPVLVRGTGVIDMSAHAATTADLLDLADLAALSGPALCEVGQLTIGGGPFQLLSPVDLQCIKACGVTFARSAVERVIEERARGDSGQAALIRRELEEKIGGGIRDVEPGSAVAAELKTALIDAGMWSQYLEVAIGPDAEIFTKAPVLSTLGWGAELGFRGDSDWNNPEPEIVLVGNAFGKVVGAALGNDVNLRDFEGRSALLLGKAKDNNASCAIGPFVRLFDSAFTIDHVKTAELDLSVEGADGYHLEERESVAGISRDPLDLISQVLSDHQYPDGFVLFLGTPFAPVQDRDVEGGGFTHKVGDVVRISSPRLGTLTNRMVTAREAAPWTFGIRALYREVARQQETMR